MNYFRISKNHAENIATDFNWQFVSVKGTRWSYYYMLKKALDLWFGRPSDE
jgi:hypothetical protein